MQTLRIHLIVMLVLLGAVAGSSSPLFAQSNDSVVFVVIDYMKVKPDMESQYVKMEKEVWKPVHEKRKDQNKLTDWNLYKVLIPFGTDVEYNYLTVSTYTGSSMLAGHYKEWGIDFEAFLDHEQKELFGRTNELRDLVRQVVLRVQDGVWSRNINIVPPKFLAMNYMKVSEGFSVDDYLSMEREIWKPLHQGRIDVAMMQGWGLYTLEFPTGTNQPFQASTIDFYQKFEHINAPYFEEIFPRVHDPELELNMMERTEKTRDLLQADIMEVVIRLD